MKQTKLLTAVIASISILGATAGFAADEAQQQTREQLRMTEDADQVLDQAQDQEPHKSLEQDKSHPAQESPRHSGPCRCKEPAAGPAQIAADRRAQHQAQNSPARAPAALFRTQR